MAARGGYWNGLVLFLFILEHTFFSQTSMTFNSQQINNLRHWFIFGWFLDTFELFLSSKSMKLVFWSTNVIVCTAHVYMMDDLLSLWCANTINMEGLGLFVSWIINQLTAIGRWKQRF